MDMQEPDYISREEFLTSEIAKLGYHTQTRQDCRNADPDDFITDALGEGKLTPELRNQILWVLTTYQDVIDWNFQGELATNHGYAKVLAELMHEAPRTRSRAISDAACVQGCCKI